MVFKLFSCAGKLFFDENCKNIASKDTLACFFSKISKRKGKGGRKNSAEPPQAAPKAPQREPKSSLRDLNPFRLGNSTPRRGPGEGREGSPSLGLDGEEEGRGIRVEDLHALRPRGLGGFFFRLFLLLLK